ncbi:LuxR family transcriptional regulator [Cochlodiniinecator piscidefendens]|uniref:LuxR family transcriptional regulator n=1 Tax=Cochlodiniinecator piscidefendens TaxID=2715756 RepID=UPI00140E7465|nr:LuxR family transcriptional regulator [Cochlodiniinecator piscidefendens]
MIVDDLNHLVSAHSVEEIWPFFLEKMANYGFERIFYGYTTFRTERSLGDIRDMIILSNHHSEYLDAFIGERNFENAPMVQWALSETGSKSWSWISQLMAAGEISPEMQRVIELNITHGVVSGYSLSFADEHNSKKGGLALTANASVPQAEVDKIWEQYGNEINILSQVFHLKIINFPYFGDQRKLTPRQREVLAWVGQGKTTQDVACILGLTTATIEKHLRLARFTLGAETTAHAVLKASMQNQIYTYDF